MNRDKNHHQSIRFEGEFEFEKRDRQALARMKTLGKRVGCAIIIITALWTAGQVWKLFMILMGE